MSTTASAETPVLAGALGYLKREWSIIPVGHDKRPLVNWKPYQERRPTVTQVRDWFDDDPEAGIAIITGAISGIVVLDVDAKSDGRESLEQLQNEHGRLPQTVTVKTGGGGRHFYFQHPGGDIRPSAGKLGRGLDIRGDGAYVVAPPSAHKSGQRYEWKRDPDSTKLAKVPKWLLTLIASEPRPKPEKRSTAAIVEGRRNDTLTSLAGAMRRRGCSAKAILQALVVENEERCQPPLPVAEVEQIARSVARYDPEATDLTDDPGGERYTDMANAARLADEATGRLAHVHEMKDKWYVYDGARLNLAAKTTVIPFVKAVARRLYGEAIELKDEAHRKEQELAQSAGNLAKSALDDKTGKISLENSREMNGKDHRVSRRCYRSGVWTLHGISTRRLDGHRLYNPSDLPRRRVCEASRRPLRSTAGQHRRRPGAAQGPGSPPGLDRATGGLPGRRAGARQGAARDHRVGPAAHLWAVCRLRRLQRRRPAGARPDPQIDGGARSAHGPGPGLAAHVVAVRERGERPRAARHDPRAGRPRDRAAAAAPARARYAHHDRSGSHRRSHPRTARVRLLQRALRHVVLSAARRHGDVQRRAGAVRGGRGAALGQGPGGGGRAGDPARLAAQTARRVSDRPLPGAPGRGLRQRQALHVSGAGAGRVRRRDAEQPAPGETGPAAAGQGASPLAPDGRDCAGVRRDLVWRHDVDASAARHHQGRGRPASGTLAQEQSPVRGHQSDRPPRALYALYCQRGDVENRLKELHHGLEMDRTSCAKFRANQFRVLLTLAAYIFFQELRRRTATTADAQVTTLRERLIKLAVWVERSARRIVLHLPKTFPWLAPWRQLARAVGATT